MPKLLLFTFIILSCSTFGQLYDFKNYSFEDGLNYRHITAINQDANGIIWLGTENGPLVSFDNESFREIAHKNHSSLNINSISVFDEKIIYSTPKFGIFKHDKTSGETTKINTELDVQLSIVGYYKNKKNEFVFTENSILNVNEEKIGTLKNLSYSSSPMDIYQVIEKYDTVFVLTNQGFYQIADNKCLRRIKSKDYTDDYHQFSSGFIASDKLILYDGESNQFLHPNSKFTSTTEFTTFALEPEETVISIDQSEDFSKTVALTNKGRLFELIKEKWKLIAHNSTQAIEGGEKVFLDKKGNIWITSSTHGLYSISKKIFTKVATSAVLTENLIYVSQHQEETFITTADSVSFVGNIEEPNSFQKLDFRINCMVHHGTYSYVGTANGVITYNHANSSSQPLFAQGHSVSAIEIVKNKVVAGVNKKGVFIYGLTNNRSRFIPKKNTFHAFQVNKNKSILYMATDLGPHVLKLTKEAILPISKSRTPSISTGIDSEGTIWMLNEQGLVGWTGKSTSIEIDFKNAVQGNPKTLIIDANDNFIIGTNSGISLLKIEEGQINKNLRFTKSNGFDGFSCILNVKSLGKQILFGTRNGLFLYNSTILNSNNIPYKPLAVFSSDENTTHKINLKTINFLGLPITYQYKTGKSKWVELNQSGIESINSIGKKPIKIRGSYDGINYGPTAKIIHTKKNALWNSEWFVLVSIAFLFALNFLFVSNYFNGKTKTINNSEEELDFNSENKLILFALLSAPITIALPYFDSSNVFTDVLPEIILFILLIVLYILHTSKRFIHQSFVFIHVIFTLVILIALYRLYVSNLNPYYMVGIVVTSGFLPLLSKRIIIPIIYSISLILVSIYFSFIIEEPIFPINLYWAVMFGCVSLTLFSTFLRSISIKKLLFTSTVVNYGKVFSVSFDNHGTVTFISQNFLELLNIEQEDILHKSIKSLNKYTAPFNDAQNNNILTHFEKNDKYLASVFDEGGNLIWLEWEQKQMKDDIRILYGRDVTNELDLENTYELLVQNAQDFIYRIDINGNFEFVNDICFDKLGYEKEDLIGQYSINIVPQQHRKRLEEFYALHFQEKRKYSYLELPIMKKNGDWVWIGQYVTTIFSIGSDKNVDGFISLARDITEKRESQSVIEKQHKVIQSNLQYAQSIQQSILPSKLEMKSVFNEMFVFTKQTDNPSGDFYWTKKIENKEFIILADCANEVISGNYTSLFVYSLLNNIILEDKIYNPEAIMNALDKRIEQVFPKDNQLVKGIEFTVCQIQDDTISYACAGSQFLISESDSLTICSGSSKKIAENDNESHRYNLMNYTFKNEVNLLFFTNGFHTQKGTNSDKTEFGLKRMIQLFESNVALPLEAQKSLIEKSWDSWVGKKSPDKDVTLISIRKSRYVKN